MNNLTLRQAKQRITEYINGLPFDIEIKRLLIKDLYDDVKDEADKMILKELSAAEQALKEKETEDGNKG